MSTLWLLPALLLVCTGLTAAEYHASPDAAPDGDGSAARPFATAAAGLAKLAPGDRLLLHPGVYRETLTVPVSGTADAPITVAASEPAGGGGHGAAVVVSGCEVVTGWREDGPGLFSAAVDLPAGWDNQVFVDGRMLWLARWPSAPRGALLDFPKATMDEGSKRGVIVDADLPDRDWSGGRVWASSHKRWYSWTALVERFEKGRLFVEDTTDEKGNHVPRAKGVYAIIGAEACFDAPWEWYYHREDGRLAIRLPEEVGEPGVVEVKRRPVAVDLRGRKHVHLRGLEIRAATVVMDRESEACVLDRSRVLHPHHSWLAEGRYGSQRGTGIRLRGRGHRVTNSEIAYSSGDGIGVQATDCEIVNCHVHDTDYIGSYASAINLGRIDSPDGKTTRPSRNNLISHCTLERTGRSLINLSSFYDSLIQFCDLKDVGFLTFDLGLVYGNCISGGGSEFRYNHLHGVRNEHLGMGLYYDHGCKNILSHHNLIWDVNRASLQNNLYAMFLLWYHNTGADGKYGYASAWNAAQPKQDYGVRVENNVLQRKPRIGANAPAPVYRDNLHREIPRVDGRPGPVPGTPERVIEGLVGPSASNRYGALDPEHPWRAGHDFEHPPEVERRRSLVRLRNRLVNAAFEAGEWEVWKPSGGAALVYQRRNRSQWVTDGKGRMGAWSVHLPAGAAVAQAVEAVEARTPHRLVVHLRAVAGKAACELWAAGPGDAILARRRVEADGGWRTFILEVPATTSSPWTVGFTAEGELYLDDTGLSVAE